ncbi:MAG: Xaa-Pro dipeptidyl-peptidase [Actinomycetota bacterium]|nr:Xaa-Pro dipeptidyl-peptidase [Actinomycetota bacterium]
MSTHASPRFRSRLRRSTLPGLAIATILATAAPAVAQLPVARQPEFADGMAQPVYANEPRLREDVWVEAPVDSDHDGANDLVHVEVARTLSTDLGVKMPVVFQPSPYYAGGNPIVNHNVNVDLYVPSKPGFDNRGPGERSARGEVAQDPAFGQGIGPSPIGPSRYEDYFVPRGFVFVYAESLGSGKSTGCPTSGGRNETIGMKAVVDWLNGRAPGVDSSGNPVEAWWTTGKVGMMGVSYNGTLPNAVASTGVEGLEAIVPIAAISSWYDYYRANGAVIAPGGFQGEDEDVLAKYVLTRANRSVCDGVIADLTRDQDRITGDYSAFWAERDYTRDVDKVRAAALVVHGLNDSNVKTKHAAAWYEALARNGVPRKMWWHNGGHADPYSQTQQPWLTTLNRWMTRWLYGVANGVESEPRATVRRENNALVTYADWPDPAMEMTPVALVPSGDNTVGGLRLPAETIGSPVKERIVDDAQVRLATMAAAAQSPHRLVYRSPVLMAPVRISGTTLLALRLAFGAPAANVSAALVDYRAAGAPFVVNRGWTDPQNRKDISRTFAIQPGSPYDIRFDLQADDYVFPAGSRIGIVLYSSDFEHSLRPPAGRTLELDTTKSFVHLPLVGGAAAFAEAVGG